MGDHARQMRGHGIDAESATTQSDKKGNSRDPGAQAAPSSGHALSLRCEPVAGLGNGCGVAKKDALGGAVSYDRRRSRLTPERISTCPSHPPGTGGTSGPGDVREVAGESLANIGWTCSRWWRLYAIMTSQGLRRSPSPCSLTTAQADDGLKPAVRSAMGGRRRGACMPFRLETRDCRYDA